jgi:hypothetical protein
MGRLKKLSNLIAPAVAIYNGVRITNALHRQSEDIAKRVMESFAQEKLRVARHGQDAMDGIADEVFEQLELTFDPMHAVDGGIIVDKTRLRQAFNTVARGVLTR